MALYHDYRPKTLDEIIGNKTTVQSIKSKISKGDVPHSWLFHGPTGCGKTTMARIIANELGCAGSDFREVDSAHFRGIDTIRDIRNQSMYQPLEGKCRGWLLDECFAEGTMVNTPVGKIPIQVMQIGDPIYSILGPAKVKNVFRNIVFLDRIVRLNLSNGVSIFTTKQHLFMTDAGLWIEAGKLSKDQPLLELDSDENTDEAQTILRMVQNRFSCNVQGQTPEVLLKNMLKQSQREKEGKTSRTIPTLCDLQNADTLLSELAGTSEQEDVRSYMWQQIGRPEEKRSCFLGRTETKDKRSIDEGAVQGYGERQVFTGTVIEKNEDEQSSPQSRDSKESSGSEEAQWNGGLGKTSRRQWEVDHPTDDVSGRLRLANGDCYSNGPLSTPRQERIPTKLQGRHRLAGIENCSRSRRIYAQMEGAIRIGRKEGRQVKTVRVESIEVYQRGSNDRSFEGVIGHQERDRGYVIFYDLEVDGHPSYFANGVAVHNCHQITRDAQSALLKALEDTPDHVFYFLCTTEPSKLLDTIRGRCAEYQVELLDELHMKKLLRTVVSAENDLLDRKVYDQIIQDAQGRPRNALQILDKVLDADPDDRLKTAKRVAAQESKTIELCRALMDGSPWSKVRSILDGLRNEDPETIRRSILGYCNAVLLGGEDDQAGIVMEQFIDPFYDSGFPGLVFACYQVIREPQ